MTKDKPKVDIKKSEKKEIKPDIKKKKSKSSEEFGGDDPGW